MKGLLSGLVLALWLVAGMAQSSPFIPRMPKDLDQVDIYLHTIDRGDLIYNNFGHTAIRVQDRQSGADWVFNWGLFDFGEPVAFAFKFYRGILIYKLGVYPYRFAQRQYIAERRTVWQDKLALSNAEKQAFLQKLIWNAQPEHRSYTYDYFFDNCSTRPRDYLDFALKGAIQQVTEAESVGLTFREFVRQGYNTNPFIQLSLDILMNSRIDRQVSVWESMFHPLYLRQALLDVALGQPLISDSKVLYEFPRPKPAVVDGPTGFALFGLTGLALILACWQIGPRLTRSNQPLPIPVKRPNERNPPWLRAGFRILGGFAFVGWLYGGLLGLLMLLTWLFSAHQDLHHNLNLLVFWPTDLMFLAPAAVWLVKGRAWLLQGRWYTFWRRYILLHAIVGIGLAMSWALGDLSQNCDQVVLFVLPVYLGLLSLAANQGVQKLHVEEPS
jgi:hypothetical protein